MTDSVVNMTPAPLLKSALNFCTHCLTVFFFCPINHSKQGQKEPEAFEAKTVSGPAIVTLRYPCNSVRLAY